MKDTPAPEQTFEEQINTHVTNVTVDADGKRVLPEGLDQATAFAVSSELRRRDTQAAYSKSQNELKAAKAENTALASNWESEVRGLLTVEQSTELEELKATDPEAWRAKLNEYETSNTEAFGTRRTAIKDKAHEGTELDRRIGLLDAFNEANPDIKLTDEVLANDVPPRYLKQLETGEVTFEVMLANVKKFLTSGKVIAKGPKPGEELDLSDMGGGVKPTDDAVQADIKQSYEKETY